MGDLIVDFEFQLLGRVIFGSPSRAIADYAPPIGLSLAGISPGRELYESNMEDFRTAWPVLELALAYYRGRAKWLYMYWVEQTESVYGLTSTICRNSSIYSLNYPGSILCVHYPPPPYPRFSVDITHFRIFG